MNGLNYSTEQRPFGEVVASLARSTSPAHYMGTERKLPRLQQASCRVIGHTKSARTLRGYELNGPGFEYRYEQEIFLLSKMTTPALGPTQPHIQ